MPKRIQRKRTKGWRMPPNTVYVGRPTKWGNPWTVIEFGAERAVALFEKMVIRHREMAQERGLTKSVHELRGKDLACWCPLDAPCHADVLLKAANE